VPEDTDATDTDAMQERLDELGDDIEDTERTAEEHGTIPGKEEPTLADPKPDDPDVGGDGLPPAAAGP
jgi:hypothetical protein